MLRLAIISLSFVLGGTAYAQTYYGQGRGQSQQGYGSNSGGHYVQPHVRSDGRLNSGGYRSNPNNTHMDNYGTRGNYNPYTGQGGNRAPRY